MKIWKRKLALILCTVLMLSLAVPFYGRGLEAEAGSKGATLEQKKITTSYGQSRIDTYGASVVVKDCNPKAKYSFSVSPKGSAEIVSTILSPDGKQASAAIKPLKKGTCKVTVKETVGKKTRKVGVCTISALKIAEIGTWMPELDIPKGSSVNVFNYITHSTRTGMRFSVADKSIAEVNSYGVMRAKKTGKTTLTVTQNKKTIRIKINVVKADKSAKTYKTQRQINSDIDALYNTKITKSNYISWYNKYAGLVKKWRANVDSYANTGRYSLDDCRKKLAAYMRTRTQNSAFGASADVLKVTKLTPKTLKLELSKAITRDDMINLLGGKAKYSKNAKATRSYMVSRTTGKYRFIYNFQADVKEGQKKITAKLAGAYRLSLKDGTAVGLWNADRGTYYSYTLRSSDNLSAQRKVIKCE